MQESNKNPQQQLLTRATLLVALSAILYGFLGCLGIKLLQQDFSISAMLFWRFFIATIWIILFSLFKQKQELISIKPNISLLMMTLMLGAICYSGTSGFYFLASQLTGTGLAMVIFFTYPLFVVLYSWLIQKQPIGKFTALALMAIIIGMIMLKGHGSMALNLAGIFFALLSALFYGIYILGSKYFIHVISATQQTLLICLSCAMVFLVIAFANHSFTYPSSLISWIYVIAIGIIATALPVQLMLAGLKYIHPNKASILSVLEPVVTLFIGMMILNEPASALQLGGAIIILLSAICIQFERN